MEILEEEAESFLTELRADYVDRFEKREISTPYQYLEKADAIDKTEEPDELKDYLQSSNIELTAFISIPPILDQDIVYSSLNPGMRSVKRSDFESGAYGRRSSINEINNLAFTWAKNYDGYLTGSEEWGVERIIQTLREGIDVLPEPDSPPYEDYVDVSDESDISESYFGDVYHTRFFKAASPGGDFLDEFDRSYWRKRFAEELEIVDPSLVVTGCRDAWRAVQDYLVSDEEEIIPHRNSTITTNYQNTYLSDETAVSGVFEIPTQDRWVVTIFQESNAQFIDFEGFLNNLNYINERLP